MRYVKAPMFVEAVRLMNEELKTGKFVACVLLREKSTYVEFMLVLDIADSFSVQSEYPTVEVT